MAPDLEILARIPLVRHLSGRLQDEVAAAGMERAVARGEILFHEGEPAEAMFSVLEGRIKLVRTSPHGKEMLLHLVRPGESFAEAALFGDRTYPATAEGVSDGRVWVLPRRRLLELIHRNPDLGVALVASVSMWTRTLAAKLQLLTQRRVEERLALFLLGRAAGDSLAEGDEILLTDPKHLIAAQLGTAPEVLSRTLRRLEEDGILESRSRGVRVVDLERLRALAEWIDE
jgi:CRP/FNR family transcriptional regulator